MKLELELMRAILLELEGVPAQQTVKQMHMDGFDQPVVLEHLYLLDQEGFIEGNVLLGSNGWPAQILVRRLTMKGHEFVRNARNDTLWKKVTSEAQEKGGSVTMTLLNRLLEKAAEKWFGLE